MERLDGGSAVPPGLGGGVVALGNFDGFHRGHQAVAGRARDLARAAGRPFVIATFDPHPVAFFKPGLPPFALTRIDQRLDLFEAFGADIGIVFPFSRSLAEESPAEFVAERLVGTLAASAVVTGEDFTFGRGRGGDAATLAALGAGHGFTTEAVAAVADADGAFSSSRIRAALKAGDPLLASKLLSRPFTIRGAVDHGDKLGRTIGYPTANIALGSYQRPAYGIYAVRARLADGRMFDGAANLGIRPMFDPPRELLEAYLFDFAGDLYGQTVDIELHHYLRPEARFDGLDALVTQMEQDCTRAKALLAASLSAS